MRIVRQSQRRQRDAREADAEFLQFATPRDRASHSFGQFIEFVDHNFPFALATAADQTLPVTAAVARLAPQAWVRAVTDHLFVRFSLVGHTQCGERDASETGTESPQRTTPRDGLGHSFGQFIELVVHNFPFVYSSFANRIEHWATSQLLVSQPPQTRLHCLMHAFCQGQQPQ
jgi:hypothetical protein